MIALYMTRPMLASTLSIWEGLHIYIPYSVEPLKDLDLDPWKATKPASWL